jgi:hypothetical protein
MRFTVPFPDSSDELFKYGVGVCSTWDASFTYPAGYVEEIKKEFPQATFLHQALERDDRGMVESWLDAYERKLGRVTAKNLVAASAAGTLDQLVGRARQVRDFKKFRLELRRRYFAEEIKKEREARKRAREEAEAYYG